MQDTPAGAVRPAMFFYIEFKLCMVELAQLPDANIDPIAREHGFNHNLLIKWLRLWQREGRVSRPRKTYNKTSTPTLLPVQVAPLTEPASPAKPAVTTCHVRLMHGEHTLHHLMDEVLSLVLRKMMKGNAP